MFNKFIFKSDHDETSLALLHLNIRSIPKNLSSLEEYLHNLDYEFNILGITETWLSVNNTGLYDFNE